MKILNQLPLLAALLLLSQSAPALDRTNETFKVFQFPPNMIPVIDGKTNDWDIVPKSVRHRLGAVGGRHAQPHQ